MAHHHEIRITDAHATHVPDRPVIKRDSRRLADSTAEALSWAVAVQAITYRSLPNWLQDSYGTAR